MKTRLFLVSVLAVLVAQPVFSWDSDKDKIPNKYDECKNEPEDYDGFEDTDGCPEPDNDKDFILDANDKCPLDPEDIDGFEDTDGCPDPDNDKDGIPDKKDKCPNEKEDFDSFEDMDGCPDPDNDKDGLADEVDKCPNDAEDIDGFEDKDGCPDFDNDKDGIKDVDDKCPNQEETFNEIKDDDGCPDVGVEPLSQSLILPFVSFRTGTAELTFESQRPLDSLAMKLNAYPATQVELLVFKPMTISPESSLELLAKQHAAVVTYLLSNGASPNQIAPADFSMEKYESLKETDRDPFQERPVEVHITTFTPSQSGAPAAVQQAPADSAK